MDNKTINEFNILFLDTNKYSRKYYEAVLKRAGLAGENIKDIPIIKELLLDTICYIQ